MPHIVLKHPAYKNYQKYLGKNKFRATSLTLSMDIRDKQLTLDNFKAIVHNISFMNNKTVIINTHMKIPRNELIDIAYQFTCNQPTATLLSITTQDTDKKQPNDLYIRYGIYKYDICQEKNRLVVKHLFDMLTLSEREQFRLLDKQYHFSDEIDEGLLDDILDIKSRY